MKIENLKLKMESYFNCSSLLRRGRLKGGRGFTLAEILIVLTVIGVISAVTVPVLIQNTQKQEYVTALKKAYSTLSQVTNEIISEEGSPKADENGGSRLSDTESIYNMYKKYLNNAKDCNGEAGCITQGVYKRLQGGYDGTNNWDTREELKKLVLADGMQLIFGHYGFPENCSSNALGTNKYCAMIYADINGAKQPNTYGRDVFAFALKEQGLYPAGCDDNGCDKSKSGGSGCTCKVIRDDAMNY